MSLEAPNDEERAYHESGHAVIAHASSALRLKPGGYVSIADGEEEFGGVDVETDPIASSTAVRVMYEYGVLAAAGFVAQRRHFLETNQKVNEQLLKFGASEDLKSIVEVFGSGIFYEFAAVAEKRFNEDSNWARVQRLSKELIRVRTINAADAEAIIDG